MSKPNEERDIYYIPPNFLASGRLFGGMIRARNAIEACVLVLLTGIPIIKLPMSLTVRIIILCLLPLPLGIFGIIGFEGDSLSEFAINWVRWFIHRRNLYRSDVTIPETARKQKKRIWEQEATKPPEELGIRIKQPRKKRKRPAKTEKQLNKNNRKMVPSHNYDAALGKRRIRDYDNIETKRYLDVIESMLLTNDSGLLCTVLQATRMSDRDSAEFYLMRPETLSSWAKNHIKTTTKTCSE